MIRPLRRRHFWMIAAIAVVVLLVYFAAIVSRPQWPVEDALLEAAGEVVP